ncbi:MAG: DUF6273 domain-containing protein, partial [Oscillospiraceae bacterium]|nr:DUF6273 domain-containing protein [Oscillospiraceae bacterium]
GSYEYTDGQDFADGSKAKKTLEASPVVLVQYYIDHKDELDGWYPAGLWALDTDGYAYWTQALLPGEATNLLLDNVVLDELVAPDDNYYYAIDVRLEASNLTESYLLYSGEKKATANGKKIVKALTVKSLTVSASGAITQVTKSSDFAIMLKKTDTMQTVHLTGAVDGSNISTPAGTWMSGGDNSAWASPGDEDDQYVVNVPANSTGSLTVTWIAADNDSKKITVTIYAVLYMAYQSEIAQWLTPVTTTINLTSPVDAVTERYVHLHASQSDDKLNVVEVNKYTVIPELTQNKISEDTDNATDTIISTNSVFKVTIPIGYVGDVTHTFGPYTVVYHVTKDVEPSPAVQVGETFAADGVEWRVLHKTDSESLIIAEHLLDTARMHSSSTNWDPDVLWSGSELRGYLNDTFMNSLTTLKSNIELKKIHTRKGWNESATYTEDISITEDYVFLLSEEDVFGSLTYVRVVDEEKGLFTYDRKPANLAYNTVPNTVLFTDVRSRMTTSVSGCSATNWWLRSHYSSSSTNALTIHSAGSTVFYPVTNSSVGIRPAMFINFKTPTE